MEDCSICDIRNIDNGDKCPKRSSCVKGISKYLRDNKMLEIDEKDIYWDDLSVFEESHFK